MSPTIVLCPVYNDESSLSIFAEVLEKLELPGKDNNLSLLIVNDGTPALKFRTTLPLHVVHLHKNIGHQKAIAIGLAYAHQHLSFDHIIVMDCDGEDRPEDIPALFNKSLMDHNIVVARRSKRQEGNGFQLFYKAYKMLFRVLTGKKVSFGNFMVLPKKEVDQLVYYSEIWNHLAGTILKSGLPYSSVSVNRGKRYNGNSKMDFTSLLLHGLGAIGVFIEVIAIRVLMSSLLLIVISIVTILIILSIRLFTDKAIPGWATTTISSMLIVLLQSFLLSLFTIFLYLSSKSQRQFIPAHHYMDYVRSVEKVNNE